MTFRCEKCGCVIAEACHEDAIAETTRRLSELSGGQGVYCHCCADQVGCRARTGRMAAGAGAAAVMATPAPAPGPVWGDADE